MGFERGATHFHSPRESWKTIPIIIEKRLTLFNKTLLIVELLLLISRRQPKITE